MEQYEFSFEKLQVYTAARNLVKEVYKLISQYPADERFALCDQMRRSAVSIPSNIAEGTSRRSYKDKVHFIEMAYGSLMEIYCQIQLSLDLGYICEAEYLRMREVVTSVARPLSGLRNNFLKQVSD